MKLSKDQKQILRAFAYYALGYVVFYPFFHWLFTKEFSWSDVLIAASSSIGLFFVCMLFVIGAKIPKK